ncbi:hypothetical protein HLRTI_000361 [Halorhabdus tiamatea SARL4B]|uniref:DUF8154 domain-containing protein n=1 Tax=Halorhabdus tiamatea SARL4B TaxID=1033806 RepID=U2E5X4_9EURY|nr:hypothetical protein HLRTI_000361 [Halorhabdus tiamatea SARL4B]
MSSTRIEQLIDDVQAAFDRPPREIEQDLDVEDAALLQLRKACRLLLGVARTHSSKKPDQNLPLACFEVSLRSTSLLAGHCVPRSYFTRLSLRSSLATAVPATPPADL